MSARLSLLSMLLPVILAGCLSVTPQGAFEMARFDPLTLDPFDLGAGLGVPDSVRLSDGSAMIVMTYRVRGEPSPVVNERFLLELTTSAAIAGAPSPQPGERIYIGRLSKLDAIRMKDVQVRILRYKSEGAEGEGSFSIGLHGGCTIAPPLTKLDYRTFVKTRPGDAYVQATRRADFVASLPADKRREFLRSFRVCNESE